MTPQGFGWIEACLRYAGRFGPREKMTYQDLFQVSAPSVSRHQNNVAKALEKLCDRDLFQRDQTGRLSGGKLMLYEGAMLPSKPVFDRVPSMDRWLQDTFDGVYFHNIRIERAEPGPDIIRPIIVALEDAASLRIQYHSRTGSQDRDVSPHSIIMAAGRLHMRAYDHGKNRYGDFVLSRITRATHITDGSIQYVDSQYDKDWNDLVQVEIRAKTTPEPAAFLGVQIDFSLNDIGTRMMRVRKALAPYILDIEHDTFSAPIEVRMESREMEAAGRVGGDGPRHP